MLTSFAEVLTAERSGCDVDLDLAWPAERLHLQEGVNAVIHLAAHFGGRDFAYMLAAEEVNALGTLKLAILAIASASASVIWCRFAASLPD